MTNQQPTIYSSAENLQSKSNLPTKPALPPKPRFSAYPSKPKVAPRPGEAKQSLLLNGTKIPSDTKQNNSNIPSKPISSSESLSSNQTSSEIISYDSNTTSLVHERSVTIGNLPLIDNNDQNENNECQHESDTSIGLTQTQLLIEDENLDDINQKKKGSSQSIPEFPQINAKPPPFKFKQFKYPSGNLSGTSNFPDFDEKLNEMLKSHQGPRLKNINMNF